MTMAQGNGILGMTFKVIIFQDDECLSLPLKWITDFYDITVDFIFCPIKCSLKHNALPTVCYKYHLAKATVDTEQYG